MLVLYLLAICLVANGVICRVETEQSSVRITTTPRQGPFRLGQRVQFSCEVEPAQPIPVAYQWRTVEYVSGSSIYFGESFNTTYNNFNLRYSWYFCTATSNKTFLGSANKLVEVHGLLQTDEPIARTFSLHKKVVMRINISHYDYYRRGHKISSLAWYHNKNELCPDDRVTITNNGTSLTISNMLESDAGKYEVKISSIGTDPLICDRNILPMLENYALYSPVTFLLQESKLSTYNPEDVILDYTLPAYDSTPHQHFTIENTFMFNAGSVLDVTRVNRDYLYKDGVSIQDRNTYNSTVSYGKTITLSLQMSYENADDIVGHYVHQVYSYHVAINKETCPGYYFNHRHYYPIFTLYWNIKSYEPMVAATTTTVTTKGTATSNVYSLLALSGPLVALGALVVFSRWKKNRKKMKARLPSSSSSVVPPLLYAEEMQIPFTAPPRYEDRDYTTTAKA